MDINQLGLIPMGDDVRAAKAAYEGAIFARANVVGVAIGNKVIRGSETDERCIVVFVEAKKPEAQLRHWDVVPKTFGNVRTDIVETGRFHALRSEQAIDLERTKRTRPAPGGGLKPLPSGHSNLVDAAVAEPIETRLVAPDILGIGRVRGTKEPDIGMRVRKSGRTTGVTEGRITAIDAVVEVDYGGPTAIFREQIVSDLLSKGGDSGSLVVDEVRHAVGLLFAGGATTTLINPIAAVAHFLDIAIE